MGDTEAEGGARARGDGHWMVAQRAEKVLPCVDGDGRERLTGLAQELDARITKGHARVVARIVKFKPQQPVAGRRLAAEVGPG